jgi:hypothetical protein
MSKTKNYTPMKKIMLGSLFFLFVAVFAHAQSTPVADKREQNQRARIREGAASGETTRAETAKLKSEQRHIRRTERRAKADGRVTPAERANLQRKQNKASRDIRRQKHDAQEKP